MAATVREYRVFLGNPGTGKSTIVNCLVGDHIFQSGISWGAGLTQEYQRYDSNGVAYMDTPGLADRAIIQQAADAITKALKEGGSYKLFFMVRLNNGRPVYEDLTTVERVLDSIKIDNVSYSIIINNIGRKQYQVLSKRGPEFDQVKTVINSCRHITDHFCLIPTLAELDEKSNQVIKLPRDVIDFIELAPTNRIAQTDVESIDVTNFEKQTEMIRSELEKLRHDQTAILERMTEQEKRHQEQLTRERERHVREVERMRNNRPPEVQLYTRDQVHSARSNNLYKFEARASAPAAELPTTLHERRLFVGNPGTGKSTLINCLVDETVFQSGVSWGSGLTQGYQQYIADGITYMDTPGLADTTIIKQAAESITTALSKPGNFKIFFVVRLRNGRVISEDVITIKRVLDSIAIDKIPFAILINNLNKISYDTLMKRGPEFKAVATCINSGKYSTPYFFFIPRFDALEEQNNRIVKLPEELIKFIEEGAPSVFIRNGAVSNIDVHGYQRQNEMMKDEIEGLKQNQAAIDAKYLELLEKHWAEIEDLQRRHKPCTVM